MRCLPSVSPAKCSSFLEERVELARFVVQHVAAASRYRLWPYQ
jgi:hypothetical protein